MGNRASNAKAERDLKNAVVFVGDQLRHPAVRNFVGDAAEIMAASGGDPELAAPALAERAGVEGNRIVNRTLDHYTGHNTPGDKSIPPMMNALTFL